MAYKNIDSYNKKLLDLREYYISEVTKRITDIRINGSMTDRLSGNSNISFKGVDGENLLLKLDSVRNMCIKPVLLVIRVNLNRHMC